MEMELSLSAVVPGPTDETTHEEANHTVSVDNSHNPWKAQSSNTELESNLKTRILRWRYNVNPDEAAVMASLSTSNGDATRAMPQNGLLKV
ncbi:hypothetical protein AeMF1_006755 [Aphanomyces euteiches]|nr:hypothetical protein AeMF1_006755 [Aphanomyces euteiches]